jgi:hypothetical protein
MDYNDLLPDGMRANPPIVSAAPAAAQQRRPSAIGAGIDQLTLASGPAINAANAAIEKATPIAAAAVERAAATAAPMIDRAVRSGSEAVETVRDSVRRLSAATGPSVEQAKQALASIGGGSTDSPGDSTPVLRKVSNAGSSVVRRLSAKWEEISQPTAAAAAAPESAPPSIPEVVGGAAEAASSDAAPDPEVDGEAVQEEIMHAPAVCGGAAPAAIEDSHREIVEFVRETPGFCGAE